METKRCTKCLIEKPLDDFRREKRRKNGNGRYSWCRACELEYKYFKRHGCPKPPSLPKPPPGMKRCSKCKEVKPLSEFYEDTRNTSTGKQSQCMQCFSDYRKSASGKASAERKRQSERYKQYHYNYYRTAEYKAKKREQAKTEAGKASRHKYKTSPRGRSAAIRYARSEKGRAQQKRYQSSPKGKQALRRNVLIRLTRKTQAGGSYAPAEWEALCAFYDYRCLACGKQFSLDKLTVDHVIPVSMGGTSNIDNLQPLCFSCNSSKNSRIIDYRTKKIWWKQLALF